MIERRGRPPQKKPEEEKVSRRSLFGRIFRKGHGEESGVSVDDEPKVSVSTEKIVYTQGQTTDKALAAKSIVDRRHFLTAAAAGVAGALFGKPSVEWIIDLKRRGDAEDQAVVRAKQIHKNLLLEHVAGGFVLEMYEPRRTNLLEFIKGRTANKVASDINVKMGGDSINGVIESEFGSRSKVKEAAIKITDNAFNGFRFQRMFPDINLRGKDTEGKSLEILLNKFYNIPEDSKIEWRESVCEDVDEREKAKVVQGELTLSNGRQLNFEGRSSFRGTTLSLKISAPEGQFLY